MPAPSRVRTHVGKWTCARINATDQNLDRRLKNLGHVDKFFPEKLSGKGRDRPELHEMIDHA